LLLYSIAIKEVKWVTLAGKEMKGTFMDEIIKKINEKSVNDNGVMKISCQTAFQIAEDLNIAILKVGQACNKAKIKISSCQLGCFK